MGFPSGSDGKEYSYSAGSLGWEDPLEEGMATHYSIFTRRIPMDRGAWWAVKIHFIYEDVENSVLHIFLIVYLYDFMRWMLELFFFRDS